MFAFLPSSPSGHVRGAISLSAIIAASTAAMASVSSQEIFPFAPGRDRADMHAPPPVPPPLLLRDFVPRDALHMNRRIPFSSDPNMPAQPFEMAGNRASFDRAVECLASAIYYEAGAEPLDGQRAVAQVVLNRVRHPAFVPSVCGVVYQGSTRVTGCQFSFTCDGSLRRKPSTSGWAKARAIASVALTGAVFAPVGYGTHYHADYVVPYWAASLAKNKVIGRHIFYRWPEWWGTAAAFARRHTGNEPDPHMLRAMALLRSSNSGAVTIDDPGQPQVRSDPRVELMRIIQFLAAGSPASEEPSPTEQVVRRHFSSYSDHVAVQIYRQLSAGDSRFDSKAFLETMMHHSEPPQLAARVQPNQNLIKAIGGTPKLLGFMSSLRDFAKQSDFDAFLQERHPQLARESSQSLPSTSSRHAISRDRSPGISD